MPFNSSGVFSLPAGYLATEGETIEPSQHNPPLEDIAQNGLSYVVHKDGRTTMTGALKMGSNKITGLADGTSETDGATVGQAGAAIGDFRDTARTLDSKWLRRDGAVYATINYPTLSPMMEQVDGSIQFTAKTSGVTEPIYDIAKGLGKVLVVGGTGTILSSDDDGDTWTAVTSGVTEDIYCIAYENSTFVCGLENGNVLTSSTGNSGTWTERTTGLSVAVLGVAYGASIWVIAAGTTGSSTDGKIYSSSDLATWTDRTPTTLNRRYSVVWTGTYFVVTGSGVTVQRSTDGTSFSNATITTGESNLYFLSYADDTLFASSGAVFLRSTDDGATWGSDITPPSSLNRVAFGGGAYLSVGDTGDAMRSTDGTLFSDQTSNVTTNFRGILWDADISKWWVVGDTGTITLAEQLASTFFRVPDDDPTYGWIKALA